MKKIKLIFLINIFLIFCSSFAFAKYNIPELIENFKKDPRGPFQSIQWFCEDGTIRPARQPCINQDGNQHALHKNIVRNLTKEKNIYLGQILTGTSFNDFWDETNQNSRLKQFIMEKYLQSIDDGWIFRRARYYRGAIQMEDEEEWGLKFLKWLMQQDDKINSQFFLIRQTVKEIPHRAVGNQWKTIRAESKIIAARFPAFTKFRVKLHGRPEIDDIQKIKNFYQENINKMSSKVKKMLRELINDLEKAFSPFYINNLKSYVPKLPNTLPAKDQLEILITSFGSFQQNNLELLVPKIKTIASLMLTIRKSLLNVNSSKTRLLLMDLSNDLENILFRDLNAWYPKTLRGFLEKNIILVQAATGCGFIELWEWETIKSDLSIELPVENKRLPFEIFMEKAEYSRQTAQWGTGMVNAVYGPVVKLFGKFESLADGFIDDRIRSSVLLSMGELAGQLADIAAILSGRTNHVMGIKDQNQIRGLNPGFAKGQLEVISGSEQSISFSDKNIYVLSHVPVDIKPVAGIAAVSEGNLVSHVQLLARNLGIPNAVIAPHHLEALKIFSGQTVFFAVSPRGTVVMKPEHEMTDQEKILMEKRRHNRQQVMVPLDKLNLEELNLLSLKDLRAFHSGQVCGPKAANLGQLKSIFPDNVADGIVIPFGVFRQHMDNPMQETDMTCWQFLQNVFACADENRQNEISEDEIDAEILENLAKIRQAIKKIKFLPEFKKKLQEKFKNEFGVKLGNLPVFIRSDTNMEDLKEFTGSGLNKTVFNVKDSDKILQGIRDVWASPFKERGYRWRQKFLLNPENVYPSILILPTINVDKSGVLITTGVSTQNPDDITIAFSKGPGGAVEGQAAETYLIKPDGLAKFISPSREKKYNVLPEKGGAKKGYKNFNQRILNASELEKLWLFSKEVKNKLPGTPGIETTGPFDVELGFLGEKIWLFQVRPYVENKYAIASAYLKSLDPEVPENIQILLDEKD